MNTVFEDLALNKGAVSNAILRVAGPQLQQLVNAQKTSANVGEIIVTDGCKMKSKQVFHAVLLPWDKGQGKAEKVNCYIICSIVLSDFSNLNLMKKSKHVEYTSISYFLLSFVVTG